MAAPTTVDEAILAAALAPKRVEKNGHQVEQHNLKDLLAVRDSGTDDTTPLRGGMGLRIQKVTTVYP